MSLMLQNVLGLGEEGHSPLSQTQSVLGLKLRMTPKQDKVQHLQRPQWHCYSDVLDTQMQPNPVLVRGFDKRSDCASKK